MKKIVKGLLIIIFLFICFLIYQKYEKINDDNKNEEIVNSIKAHYAPYVITNKEANLYKDGNVIGKIGKDVVIEIKPIEITKDTEYFEIKDLNYLISYKDVGASEQVEIDDHYKKYVVYNEDIVTNDVTNFYNDNGLVYQINQSFNLPIIIKDDDKYYVEYNTQLVYVKKEDVKKVVSANNTSEKTRENIRTVAYHFVYKEGDECTNYSICHPVSQFTSHIKYLKDNNYFALTMKDLELFLDNKIRIPEKSVVITLDDGYLAENAIKILNEYEINATYFLVTSWADPNVLKSKYVELASHTNDMHNNYKCPGGNQGGQILCENEDVIIKDLETSRKKLNNTEAFCFPFYDYNDYSINILKKVGFKLAFIGSSTTEGVSNHYTDKFKIPRLTMLSSTSLEEFIDLVK